MDFVVYAINIYYESQYSRRQYVPIYYTYTLDRNRFETEIMNNAPSSTERVEWMAKIFDKELPTYVTLERIMDFV